MINFLVNNPYGTIFLKTVDASKSVKDAKLVFELLDGFVEEIGEEIVVQVVTDNASAYKAAGAKLMENRQSLYWTPCAAHCIDLMLEKIGELPQHRNALTKSNKVSNFIYNHLWVLERPCSTSCHKICHCLFDVRKLVSNEASFTNVVCFSRMVIKCMAKKI